MVGVELTIAHILRCKLLEAVSLSSKTLGVSEIEDLKLEAIPLRAVKGGRHLVYVSALALKLANVWKQPAEEVAGAIAAHLSCFDLSFDRFIDPALQNFTVKVVAPNLIHLQLNDRAIAAWLQYFAQTPPRVFRTPNPPSPNSKLFYVQYAHARCCSLLRLADRYGAIALNSPSPEISPNFFSLKSPHPIPWLDSDQKLRLLHPAECSLITQVLTLPDDLYKGAVTTHPVDWEKSAHTLSRVFLNFYSQCRIWGEVKTENPQLAQARLGLIMATQPLLRSLLEDFLGVLAPLEL